MRSTYGWAEVSEQRKREIVDAIASGGITRGPLHAELDLTDRCNVACYFCNQQDVRTKEFVDVSRVRELLDELAEGGLRSVRMSGGGDPLYHRDVLAILDMLAERKIVIDNLTTNAALMGPEISARLVRDGAREVVVSLNAVDGEDYARMMKVKPAIFDRVVENVRHLISIRNGDLPCVVIQFLLDRENYEALPRMYEIARDTGADTIVVNPVMDIPRERIDRERLLKDSDIDLVRPVVRQTLEMDRESRLLQISFPSDEWNRMVDEEKRSTGVELANYFPTASTFRDGDGGCFFGWYTMTVRGNGDLYPCCMLMNPDYEPLGNASQGSILEHWQGKRFSRLRAEMRHVLLRRGKVFYRPSRFTALRKQCIEPGACWLKNNYFRGDEEFYRQLGQALDEARLREVGLSGRLETLAWDSGRLRAAYEAVRLRTRGVRRWMKRRLGLNVAGPSVRDS
jgi:MoaA/NifB/PqqE/SkfB family radical SAM enzyme